MSKEKVVVFGGAGFLGSHVVDKLSLSGFKVTLFDRKEPNSKCSDHDVILGDILDAQQVKSAIQGASYVYNFAALADLNKAIHLPLETIKQNILATLLSLTPVLNAELRDLYASTVYVYSRSGGF